MATGQVTDPKPYIPKINLTATNGFGPYVLGESQENKFIISDLPAQTSKIMFRFIDADSVQVGDAFTKQGVAMDSASWKITLTDFDMPMSPQVHVQVNYKGDSVANYYVAYPVYPDTVCFLASKGWGPFVTNNYTFSDTSWHPVSQVQNTFTVKHLPPRTKKIKFRILRADYTVYDSLVVNASPGQHLESATYPNVRMDNLPLSIRYLQILAYCHGFADQGMEFHKLLSIVPQKPRLISKSGGVTLTDSIAVCVHNPVNGQALLVDSVKHAVINNGPGTPIFGRYTGPYSFDVIKGDFSIEAWIKLDLANVAHNNQHVQEFIHVDSVFSITYVSEYGGNASAFRLYAIANGMYYQLYEASFNNTLLQGKEWHYFTFCLEGQLYNIRQFYLDGNPLTTTVNQNNITYIQQHIPYTNKLKTKPLVLGGIDHTQFSFVKAFDEVKIWCRQLSQDEIRQNMHQKVLQHISLIGYWDFDDLRNRLNITSDLSFNNNTGQLKNNAAFIPENPDLFTVLDTLVLKTSMKDADSVKFSIVNEDGKVTDSVQLKISNHQAQWVADVSAFPYTVGHLRVGEMDQGSPRGGFETTYAMRVHAPAPVATPQCNWGTYYSADNFGTLTNPIVVSGFPDNTTRVDLGLMNGNNDYNTDTYTLNSVPYQFFLTLNGTDNYIQTSGKIQAPSNYEISLWFKTTSTQGGKLIGFCDQQNGITTGMHDREIIMEKNGALRFEFLNGSDRIILYGANKYNDGFWHCVTVRMDPPAICDLSIDGCTVEETSMTGSAIYEGYWVIGRNNSSGLLSKESVAEYFQGSLAYISIWLSDKDAGSPVDYALLNGAHRGTTLYKLDEGKGTQINDSQGNNGAVLKGTTQNWTKTTTLSMVRWEHNMIDKEPGTYTFFARVYYAGGGEEGVYYPLGNYTIQDPVPGCSFGYRFSDGVGYYNEGVSLYNTFFFETDYTGQENTGWLSNFVRYYFLSPAHQIIDHNIFTWTPTGFMGSLTIDMGDAPPGSYINFQVGYLTNHDTIAEHYFSVPILIRPMLEPTISGDFGPFVQAIAPGTMKHDNTFIVSTEGLSDLTKMTAVFYNAQGNVITSTEGVHIDDTTWHITQNMAALAPPESYMNISYYLGTNHFLAVVAGPYKITIHKTKPDWFDFIGDSAFSTIKEYADSVTFQLTTPFESSYLINNSEEVSIPSWVPLIGDSQCSIEMPGTNVHLKYIKSESKLVLGQPPEFFNKVFNLGAGSASTLAAKFNYSQQNTYELDASDNLLASQNFSMGGSLASGFNKFQNVVSRVNGLIQIMKVADPGSIIVSPSFKLTYSGSYEYSSRLHLMVDPTTGKWGSYGNLDVCADIQKPEAYTNSSSFHFYSSSVGLEFSVGGQLMEGLVSGYFGIDGRFVLGFGHSYVTIPSYKEKPLRSFAFQTYGRFYVEVLWGWYTKTVWGPKMFSSTTLWGDDMKDVFPPMKAWTPATLSIAAHPGANGLIRTVRPVSSFSQMPLPHPQAVLSKSDQLLVFSWMERGGAFGQRILRGECMDLSDMKFRAAKAINDNDHAPNNPSSSVFGDTLAIMAWAQSRHTDETFALTESTDPLGEFIRSQDIWYAIYDTRKDSILQTDMLKDQYLTVNDGRAEGNPMVTMLSIDRAMITWQVVDMEIPESGIWYAFLEFDGSQWKSSGPALAISGTGVETGVKLASPAEGTAVLVWLNTSRDDVPQSKVMSSYFNGVQWTAPELVSVPSDNQCNYIDMAFVNGHGALAYTVFMEDTANGHHEKLKLVPWVAEHFRTELVAELMTDSVHHIQLPSLAIHSDGSVALAVKKECMMPKDENHKISQVDILKGDLHALHESWNHIKADPYVCDTTRQVSELNLSFVTSDTLILLSQEYPMLATNASSVPRNGIIFGDPYMNQVLRSFAIDQSGVVTDVDENLYALGIQEPDPEHGIIGLLECYPNPCRDQTTIRFSIAESSQLVLEIYDLRGKQVAILLNQEVTPGAYEIDVNTMSLQPDTYLCRLQAGNSVRSLKLIVSR